MTPSARPLPDPVLEQLIEELTERLQAGESVDVDSYARRHPEHAEQLRRCLPALEALVGLGESSGRDAARDPNPALHVPPSGEPEPGPGPEPRGRTLGDFRLIREVGRGGMGVVYEAEQISLRRRVALKTLPLAAVVDPKQLQRFQIEAQAAALLHHTNIVPIYSVGCERGVHYYAMQFIDGQPLSELIRELRRLDGLDPAAPAPAPAPPAAEAASFALVQTLVSGRLAPSPASDRPTEDCPPPSPPGPSPDGPSPEAGPGEAAVTPGSSTRSRAYARSVAWLGQQAAEALEHAHEQGVLHRDIKPGNLLLDARGTLWVADFGLARFQDEASLTMTGDLLGTLRYMSPEQATARRVMIDHRTDIYSLGVTLYELLALRPAIDGGERAHVLRRIVEHEPTPLHRLNPAVPRDLATIVGKAMAKEAADRYASSAELANDLRRFLEGQSILARRPSLLDRASKWARRHTAAVVTAVGVLAMIAVGSTVSSTLIWREKEKTESALYQAEFAATEAGEHAGRALAEQRRAEESVQLALKALEEVYLQVAEETIGGKGELDEQDRAFLEKVVPFYRQLAAQSGDDPQMQLARATANLRVANILNQLRAPESQDAEAAFLRAIELFEDLADRFPDDPDYRRHLGKAHHLFADFLNIVQDPKFRDFYRAREHAREAVRLDPENAGYHVHLSVVVRRFDEIEEALALLERARELQPSSSWAARERVIVYTQLGRHREALAEADELARIHEDYWTRAHHYSHVGNHEKAIADFTAALERDPGIHYLYSERADSHLKLGRHEEALADLDRAIELAPLRSWSYKRRAWLLFQAGRYPEALADLVCAVESNPTDLSNLTWVPLAEAIRCPDASYRLGTLDLITRAIALLADDRPAEAPGDRLGQAYLLRAQVHALMGDRERAAEDRRAAGPFRQDLHYDWFLNALFCLEGGDHAGYRDACATMLRDLDADESSGEAVRFATWGVALAPDAVDDLAPVIDLAERDLMDQPDDPATFQVLGLLLYRAGRFEEALEHLARAEHLTNSRSSPAYSLYGLSMTHHRLGQTAEARRLLDEANAAADRDPYKDARIACAPGPSVRRLTLTLLRQEAEALIPRPDEADRASISGLDVPGRIPTEFQCRLPEAAGHLARFYDAQARPDQADRWREALAETSEYDDVNT